jgi:hypothetical protein
VLVRFGNVVEVVVGDRVPADTVDETKGGEEGAIGVSLDFVTVTVAKVIVG